MKIKELLNYYLIENKLRPASMRSYEGIARVFAVDLKNPDLETLTVRDFLCWREQVLSRARSSTWNTYHRHIRAMWRLGMRMDLLSQDPFLRVKSVPAQQSKKILHKDAVTVVCKWIAKHPLSYNPPWFWIIVLRFMYATGARRRQVVALRWRDIDWDNNALTFSFEGSKTRRVWIIPLTQPTINDLHVLLNRTLEYLIPIQHPLKLDALLERQVFCLPLFNNRIRMSKDMHVDHLSRLMRRLSDEVGFKISSHRIRHTTATRLASGANPDIKSVQQYLGHSSVLQTLEYVHPDIDQMRLLHEKLDNRPWDVLASDLDP